jgi:alpha-beta hydrolase superfamily lysophospholipase
MSRARLVALLLVAAVLASANAVAAWLAPPPPQVVSFPARDGWIIHADLYGRGDRGVVLIHGGRFTKESWAPQAEQLAEAGFLVLAIDLRGFGMSKDGPASLNPGFGSPLDALASMRYLRKRGAKTVSVVGASMGADAAAAASIEAEPGEIDRIVLLAGSADQPGEKLKGRKLFIVTRDDANAAGPRLPMIQRQYEQSKDPKQLIILDGSAHAQFILQTGQGERLMREIMRFLSEP